MTKVTRSGSPGRPRRTRAGAGTTRATAPTFAHCGGRLVASAIDRAGANPINLPLAPDCAYQLRAQYKDVVDNESCLKIVLFDQGPGRIRSSRARGDGGGPRPERRVGRRTQGENGPAGSEGGRPAQGARRSLVGEDEMRERFGEDEGQLQVAVPVRAAWRGDG